MLQFPDRPLGGPSPLASAKRRLAPSLLGLTVLLAVVAPAAHASPPTWIYSESIVERTCSECGDGYTPTFLGDWELGDDGVADSWVTPGVNALADATSAELSARVTGSVGSPERFYGYSRGEIRDTLWLSGGGTVTVEGRFVGSASGDSTTAVEREVWLAGPGYQYAEYTPDGLEPGQSVDEPFTLTLELPGGTNQIFARVVAQGSYSPPSQTSAGGNAQGTLMFCVVPPEGSTIISGTGHLRICPDGFEPPEPDRTLSVNDVALEEGNAGTKIATFDVTLSAPAAAPVTVEYVTVNGSAAAPVDFKHAAGTVTFAAGEEQTTISVPVTGDTTCEAHETFVLTLADPTGATLADGEATGTILNDDGECVTRAANAGETVTTDGEGDGADAADPLETAVTAPQSGTVSITEKEAAADATAYSFLGWVVDITAPPGDAANPLQIAFTVDSSLLPSGTTAEDLTIFRNGVAIPDCSGGSLPCVQERMSLPGGDARILVLTTHASEWTFGIAQRAPGKVTGRGFVVTSDGEGIDGGLRYGAYHAKTLTALALGADGRSAWFAGLDGDGRSFLAYVEDNGEGRSDDVFRLWVAGDLVTPDEPARGNVQIHRK